MVAMIAGFVRFDVLLLSGGKVEAWQMIRVSGGLPWSLDAVAVYYEPGELLADLVFVLIATVVHVMTAVPVAAVEMLMAPVPTAAAAMLMAPVSVPVFGVSAAAVGVLMTAISADDAVEMVMVGEMAVVFEVTMVDVVVAD